MSKLQVKIDEFHSAQGGCYKLPNGAYVHYSCGPDNIFDTQAQSTVDIEAMKKGIEKYFEEMVRKNERK